MANENMNKDLNPTIPSASIIPLIVISCAQRNEDPPSTCALASNWMVGATLPCEKTGIVNDE